MMAVASSQIEEHRRKCRLNRLLKKAKYMLLYYICPLIMVFSLVGILEETSTWCSLSRYSVVTISFLSLAMFVFSVVTFLSKKYDDPNTSIIVSKP